MCTFLCLFLTLNAIFMQCIYIVAVVVAYSLCSIEFDCVTIL